MEQEDPVNASKQNKPAFPLRLPDERYRDLFYNSPLPMWIYDAETLYFLEVNNVAMDKYGYSREEFLSMTLKNIRPREDLQNLLSSVDKRTKKDYSCSGTWQHVKKNGDILFVEITSHRLRFEEKDAVLVLASDVTEKKKAEELLERKNNELIAIKNELERSERGLREAQAMAHLGSWEAEFPSYKTKWSDEVYDILGTNKLEMAPSLEAFLSLIYPEDLENVKKTISWAEQSLETYSLSFRIIRKGGAIRQLYASCKFIFNEGKPVRLYGIIRDITESYNAEEQLRHSEARLKQAQAVAKMGHWEINFATNISKWSDEAYRIYGLEPGDHNLPYETWLSFIHPEDSEEVKKEINRSRDTLADFSCYHRIIRKDGTIRFVHSESKFEFDHKGTPVGLYGLVYDITERRNDEHQLRILNEQMAKRAEELAASNAELERFAYVASHDLQEPLRMVSSFLQLLQRKYGGQLDETAGQYINYAVDGAERMKRLILDLLEYSRIGTNKDQFTGTDMSEVVAQVLQTFTSKIQETGALIKIQAMPVIKANKMQVIQLLQNLVGNALKYNNSTVPEIEIGCEEKSDVWQFFVKDNGIGIEQKYFDKVFAIFQRLHNKTKYSGTGIGLAICKKIIEKHQGQIWVESNVGEGSIFFFTLKKLAINS